MRSRAIPGSWSPGHVAAAVSKRSIVVRDDGRNGVRHPGHPSSPATRAMIVIRGLDSARRCLAHEWIRERVACSSSASVSATCWVILPTFIATVRTAAMTRTANDEMAFVFGAAPYLIMENIEVVSTSIVPRAKNAQIKSLNVRTQANKNPAPIAGATMGKVTSRKIVSGSALKSWAASNDSSKFVSRVCYEVRARGGRGIVFLTLILPSTTAPVRGMQRTHPM